MALSITGAKESEWFKHQTVLHLGGEGKNMSLFEIEINKFQPQIEGVFFQSVELISPERGSVVDRSS